MDLALIPVLSFAFILINIILSIFLLVRLNHQSDQLKQLIENSEVTTNERVLRIRRTQKIVREIYRSVFEGYSNARGQPRMTTEFLADYSSKQSELESLVHLIDDKQLIAFVEQGLMPEAPSATGDWTAQLGKKTKLIKHIHTRLYELLEEVELFESSTK